MAKLAEKPRKFLEESPYVGVVTTLREDGSPHSTIVWVDVEGDKVSDAQIDKLAKKYLGKDEYPWRNPEETRVKVLIKPEKVDATGFDE